MCLKLMIKTPHNHPCQQAPLLQLESSTLRLLKSRGLTPPWLARWAVTNAILLAAAHHYFFPPLEVHTATAQAVAMVRSSLCEFDSVKFTGRARAPGLAVRLAAPCRLVCA